MATPAQISTWWINSRPSRKRARFSATTEAMRPPTPALPPPAVCGEIRMLGRPQRVFPGSGSGHVDRRAAEPALIGDHDAIRHAMGGEAVIAPA
jgi:hypothetical protein